MPVTSPRIDYLMDPDRMLREIIVHSTGSFALEHEVFSDGGTCVWSQELKGRRFVSAGNDYYHGR